MSKAKKNEGFEALRDALIIRKGVITAEQFKEITGKEFF